MVVACDGVVDVDDGAVVVVVVVVVLVLVLLAGASLEFISEINYEKDISFAVRRLNFIKVFSEAARGLTHLKVSIFCF